MDPRAWPTGGRQGQTYFRQVAELLSDECCIAVEEEVSQSGWAPGHSGQGDSWKASSGRVCTDSECGEVPLADRKQQVLSSR